ncbi:hypothetical protein PS627_00426 [Pseudomonas fluorescens]|nr:hypothetical protein PS627_00426 [Pseudomonas fluorescens]
MNILMGSERWETANPLIRPCTDPQIGAVDMSVIFACLVTAAIAPTQFGILPGLPSFDMYRTAHCIRRAFELPHQPMWRHPTVGIGAGEPMCALFKHPGSTGASRLADIAGRYLKGFHLVAPGDGCTAVCTAIQNHQNADFMAGLLGVPGSRLHSLQTAPQAACLVMRGNDHGNHAQVSSRSITLG